MVETGDYNKYTVMVDGSGRLTTRNRRFLRPIQPYRDKLAQHPSPPAGDMAGLDPGLTPESPALTGKDNRTMVTKAVSATRKSHRIMRQHASEM